MASIVGSEVEIEEMVDIQIQEVEVEPIPVEMAVESVETTGMGTIDIQPMIALQPLPEPAQEIVLSADDQMVIGNHNFVYVDNIPVPAPEIEVNVDDTLPSTSRKGKGPRKKVTKATGFTNKGPVIETSMGEYTLIDPSSLGATNRKWEQKQVQIKTLEGEFSVTMWATGN